MSQEIDELRRLNYQLIDRLLTSQGHRGLPERPPQSPGEFLRHAGLDLFEEEELPESARKQALVDESPAEEMQP